MVRKLLNKLHASYEDWDLSLTYWQISTAFFVSPPSSIRWQPYYVPEKKATQLCKNPATLQLPQGRIVTQVKPQNYYYQNMSFIFRAIPPPGNWSLANCYYAQLSWRYSNWTVYERVNGVNIRSFASAKAQDMTDNWKHYRITWWLAWGILMVQLEKEIAGVWTQEGALISIPDPLFGSETYQRPGLIAHSDQLADQFVYFDDTEIWGPTA